jgi:fructose-1,6-bisphosphatase
MNNENAAAQQPSEEKKEEEEVVEKVDQSWQATAEKATKVQSFLMDGVELNLSSDEVAPDFCDAASPLSLAGYMNGEFLLEYIFCSILIT